MFLQLSPNLNGSCVILVWTMSEMGTIHLRRRHVLGGRGCPHCRCLRLPMLGGEGGSPLPMFADARGGGVLGLPTSAINPQ